LPGPEPQAYHVKMDPDPTECVVVEYLDLFIIVSCVKLSVFQLDLEHLTYFWNVSGVTWNAFSVIWNASSVNSIHVQVKKRIGMCLV
jgi:hypothetical protein